MFGYAFVSLKYIFVSIYCGYLKRDIMVLCSPSVIIRTHVRTLTSKVKIKFNTIRHTCEMEFIELYVTGYTMYG